MEDIEYLEEYEDLVLPALNSAAAATATSSALQNQTINNEGDDSSSSLDQDIFNCLFDDNSDDEDFNEQQKGDTESALRQKTGFPESFDALDDNIEELAEKVIEKVEISRQDQTTNFSNTAKTESKITSSTPKYKTFMTKTSGTTIPLNTIRQETSFTNKNKSIATVRPTVQSRQQQHLNKKSNLLTRPVPSTSSFVQRQNPSTSSSSFSKNPAPSSTIQKSTTKALTGVNKRPATIVRPEKIITKDPANDPLDLDEFSEAGLDNSSSSDISGETYNSFSDFVDDDSNDEFYSGDDDYYDVGDDEEGVSSSSQVIEISNDSSGAPSNLEDLRASTPSPVISDDSDTPSSSFGFKTKKSKFIKPYSHPDIIESVLRKGKKPLLLELLHKYNLLEDSVEDNEGDNIVIDITKSSENLVENLVDTQQVATSLKDTLPLPSPTAKQAIDPVDLNRTENDTSITADLINKNTTTHSKKTNKKKSKKKSITNMDYRDLKSSGSLSADSDLSEVEELLEESYAEAMKRVKDAHFPGQELGAEIEIVGQEDVTATEQNKQKLPKAGVVIDYDDIQIEEPAKDNKNEKTVTDKKEQSDSCQMERPTQEADQKNAKTLLENVEIKDKELNIQSESKDCLKQKDTVEENFACKNENITDNASQESNIVCQKVTETTKLSDNIKSSDSSSNRKKKRFRNLITPEPNEGTSEAAKSIDDIKDFKGFEENQAVEAREKIETKEEHPHCAEETLEKVQKIGYTEKKDRPPESFKSPSSTHQPLKDKAKEFKDKNSRDNSKETRDKGLNPSKNKSFRDGSKDRSSAESSRDNSSRESSKDRSRESSKDRSKHSYDKDATTKHHHKDHRKSSDSQESSRSRESSKSRDLKETKYTKTDSKDLNKSTSDKIQKLPESSKEKSTEKKDVKTSKGNEKGDKDICKTSLETKTNKERDNKKELKDHKSSLEKQDKKPAETNKPKEKDSYKPLPPASKEHKQKELIDARKSSSFSTKSEANNSSRDSSKERKNINKPVDSPKSISETKKSEYQKNTKVSTDTDKSITNKPSSSIPAENVKNSNPSDKPKEIPKSSQDSKNADKVVKKSSDPTDANKSFKPITKSATDSKLILKNTPVKKPIQSPASSKNMSTSSTDLNTSKSFSKSNEADKKDPQKIVKVTSSDSKKPFKTEDQNKKSNSDMNKSVNEKSQLNKLPDHSNTTKTQTPIKNMPKKTISTISSTKRSEGSNTKPGNLETKDTSAVKSTSDNVKKIKTVQSDEMKLNVKSSDSRKPAETLKNTAGSEQSKPVESLSKDTKTTPKEEIIKKTAVANINESVKAKNQEELKSLDKETPQKTETTKLVVNKIEDKANELAKAKSDPNNGNDLKQTVDLTTGSEKTQTNSEKKQVVKSRVDSKETKTETTPQTKEKKLNENQDGADTQKAKAPKVNKDELKEKNSKTDKEKPNDKETKKNDNATLQKNSEKPKLVPTSDNEHKDKKQEVGSNTPDNSNNSSNEKTQTTTNKEQSENKQDKAAPRKSENPKDQSRTTGKTQATANNEQKGKKQEKTEPRTPERSNDSVTVKEKTQTTTTKKQQEKPQEKAEPRKSENPNDPSTTKEKAQTAINKKENEKNKEKIEPRTRENSNDSVTVKGETQTISNNEQEKKNKKAEPAKSDNTKDSSTAKGKSPTTTSSEQMEKKQEKDDSKQNENPPNTKEKTQSAINNEQKQKMLEKSTPRTRENSNDSLTTKEKTQPTTNKEQNEKNEKKQEKATTEKSKNPSDPPPLKGKIQTVTNNKQQEKKQEKAEPRKSETSNVSSTPKEKIQTPRKNEQKDKIQEKSEPRKSENPNVLSTPKGKIQTTTNTQQKEKKQVELKRSENPGISSTVKGKTQTFTKNEQKEKTQEIAASRKAENPNDSLKSKEKIQTTAKSEANDEKQERAEPGKSENKTPAKIEERNKKQAETGPTKIEIPRDPTMTKVETEISTKNEQKEKIPEKAEPKKIESPNDSLAIKGKTQTTVKVEEKQKNSENPNVLSTPIGKSETTSNNEQKEKKQEKTDSRKIENSNDSLISKGKIQTTSKNEEDNKKQAKAEPKKIETPSDPSVSKTKTQTFTKSEQKEKNEEKAEPIKSENPKGSLAAKGKIQTTIKIEQKETVPEKAQTRKEENPKDLSTSKEKTEMVANIDKVKESDKTEKALVSTTKSVSSPKTFKKPQKQSATTSDNKTNPAKSVTTIKHAKSKDVSEETNKKDISSIQTRQNIDVKKEMETRLKSKIDPPLETAQPQSDIKEESNETKLNSSEKIKTEKRGQIISKEDKKPVLQEKAGTDVSTESRKTKNLIENKLHKSAVVLIEPLPIDKNVKAGIAIKSRITRSRNDNTKLNDSITSEKESAKEKLSQNTDNLPASERKNKPKSEEPNAEIIKTRKKTDVKIEPEKFDNNKTKGDDKEITNICQIAVADSSKREIGEKGLETKIEKDKGKLDSDDMSKDESSTHKGIKEHFKSERDSKRTELEVKTENEKNEIAKLELSEEKDFDKKEDNLKIGKTSSQQEIAEIHQEHSGGDIKGETDKEKLEISHSESCDKKIVPKLEPTKTKENKEHNKDEEKVKKDTTIEITSTSREAELCKSIKTKSSDLKEEVGKEKTENLHIEPSERTSTQKEGAEYNPSLKTKEGRDTIKEEAGNGTKFKSQIQIPNVETSALKESEVHFEPIKTRKRGEIKHGKEKTDTSENEKSLTQKEPKENVNSNKTKNSRGNIEEAKKQQIETLEVESSNKKTIEPKQTRTRSDLKEIVEKVNLKIPDVDSSNENSSARKESKEHFDPIKTRRRGEEESGNEKTEKLQKDLFEEHYEPRKTRSRGEQKEELEKEKMGKPQIESSDEKTLSAKESEEHFEQRKTRRRGELKEDAGNEKTPIKSSDQKQTTQKEAEEKSESIKTVRRSDLKVEVGKRKRDISQTELSTTEKDAEEHIEPIKTRRRVENKEEAEEGKKDSSKIELSEEKISTQKEVETSLKSTKTKSSRDLNEETKIEKSETSQVELSDKKNTTQKDAETIKTRSRDNPKEEAGKEKAKTLQIESALKDCEEHFEPRKTRSRTDVKIDAGNEKIEKAQIESSVEKTTKKETEEHLEPIKTRRHCDSKVEAGKDKKSQIGSTDEKNTTQKKSKDILEPIKTRKRGDLKEEEEREKFEILHDKSFEEKRSETTIKTRRDKEDHKDECVKAKKETLQTESAVEKLVVQNKVEEINIESTKIRTRGAIKGEIDKEEKIGTLQIESLDEKSSKEKEKNIEPTKKRNEDIKAGAEKDNNELSTENISVQEKTVSTNDEKQLDKVTVKVTSDDGNLKETTEVLSNSENEKKSQESISSEAEMSGGESSIISSNSDNTLRRTLRKRGTESPFPENDNIKKTFKGTPLKSAAIQLTPKQSRLEKPGASVLNVSSKRPLRSPAFDTESPISTKRPKLETPRKTTTRFRNLHEDCLEEKELPIITSISSQISKEQRKLQEKQEIISESLKQTTNTKEVKDTSKITAVSERKTEEKTTATKTPQTSTNVLQRKEVLVKEVTKQRGSKEDLKTSLRSEETKSKQGKSEQSTKIPETPIQSKTIKTKDNTTLNKSAECAAVISFSDWLKAKNSNTTTDINEECISAATKETTPNISIDQSKIKSKIVEPKPTENKDKTDEVAKAASHNEAIMICQNKTIETVLEGKQSSIKKQQTTDTNESMENMNVTEKLDNSLLEPSENQSQNALKQQKGKTKNKRGNAKQQRITTNKISKKPTKTQTSPTITPPRIKKTETDLLIEAMSKEMKDGGITDLLRAETHVKRQRPSFRRKTNSDSAEQLKSSASTTSRETTLAAAAVQIPNAYTPGLALNKGMPKVLDFSENFELVTSKEIMKSPTRRKIPQTIEKSQKFSVKPNDEPKVFATKSRKSYHVKELTWQVEKDNMDYTTTRKSMPLLRRESPIKETSSLSSRRTMGSSTLLNVIPNAENIKTLYAEDKKRSDSRNKIHQTENLLKRFKCRKLKIILDRSSVQKYWKSINEREKQIMATSSHTVLKNVSASMPAIPAADAIPIIQNNSETSLRIESVIDASTILHTKSSAAVLTNAQGSIVLPDAIPSSVSLQDSVNMSTIQQQQQQQQEQPFILPNIADTGISLNTALVNVSDANEIIELKNEFMDENPTGLNNDAIPPDTSNLLARAQSITEAAQHALSNSVTPTDIRLLTADSSENNFVPSFGVVPTALDNKGTCMYTFLHPAKYNRNHSNVLLDYCCPNLNGPMPAIDPTRIHAQVQVPIIELPASIVLTTKVVTKADLESENSPIPSIIRKKAEKIRKNMATHHKLATITTSATNTQPIPTPIVPAMTQPLLAPTPRPTLPPTINALTKQLPATTTITAKIRPPLPQESANLINQPTPNLVSSVASTYPKNAIVSVIPKGHYAQLSNVQHSSLRSNLRRFDVLLKQLVHPYETLNFVERHRIIEAVITSGKLMPKDLEQTLVLMEEYLKHTLIIKNDSLNQSLAPPTPAILSTNNYATSQTPAASTFVTAQMPQLQPSPKILASSAATTTATANSYSKQFEQTINKSVRKVQQSGSKNTNFTSKAGGATTSTEALMKQQQVPIYDTDRNIIGYQMRMMTPMSSMPAYTKSTMSTPTGAIMSTSMDTSNNKITSYRVNKRAVKRLAQDSPRVFYTTPPLKTSTPKAITDSHMHPTQQAKNAKPITQKTQGSIGLSLTASSETITTTTTATVKRVTRSTATGSKIIIVSKSNQTSEETILPDANSSQQQTEQTEIKNEKDIEGFLA